MIKKDNKEHDEDKYKKVAKSAYCEIFSEHKSSNKLKSTLNNSKPVNETSDSVSHWKISSHSSQVLSQVLIKIL